MAMIRYNSQEFDQYIKKILTEGASHYDKPYMAERRIRDFVRYGIDYGIKDLIDLWVAHRKFPIRRDIPELRLRTACHLIRQGIHHGIYRVTSHNTYISLTLSSSSPQYLNPPNGGTLVVDEEEMRSADRIYEMATRKKIALAIAPCIKYILNHWTTMSGADTDRRLGLQFDFPRVNSEEEIFAATEAELRRMNIFRQLSWATEVRVQMIRRMYLGDSFEPEEDVDSLSSLII